MHPDAHMLIGQFASEFQDRIKGKKVLDVGSQDINGNNRAYFPETEFCGLDIRPGPGVDVVCEKEDVFPFPDAHFDVVISNQTLEHCRRPWNTVKEMARVLKPGGLIYLSAPWRFQVHKDGLCPTDCWRILEDGMQVLFDEGGIKTIRIASYGDDCYGIGEKPKESET